ncbi:MAG: radical SAM protein [Bacteroidales bacterium]|nr:radical SAM protein [Bacteroidales bacterium]
MLAAIPGIKDLAMTTNGILLDKMAQPLKDAGLKRVNISLDTIDPVKYSTITRGGDIQAVFRGIEAARVAGLSPVKINCVLFSGSDRTDADRVKEFCRSQGLEIRFIRQMNLITGEFSVVEGGEGGNCRQCNRIRLTANGMVKPCLFDEQEFPVRELGARQAILNAIAHKPLKGCTNRQGSFYNIGG